MGCLTPNGVQGSAIEAYPEKVTGLQPILVNQILTMLNMGFSKQDTAGANAMEFAVL